MWCSNIWTSWEAAKKVDMHGNCLYSLHNRIHQSLNLDWSWRNGIGHGPCGFNSLSYFHMDLGQVPIPSAGVVATYHWMCHYPVRRICWEAAYRAVISSRTKLVIWTWTYVVSFLFVRSLFISKMRNSLSKMYTMHQCFSTFSSDNLSDKFAIFHHALNRSMISSRRHDIIQCVQAIKVIYCTCFFQVGALDFNHVDGFLTCSIDLQNILHYFIPWDVDYTQACTTSITTFKTAR